MANKQRAIGKSAFLPAVFIALALAVILCGCPGENECGLRDLDADNKEGNNLKTPDNNPTPGTFPGLSLEKEMQIRQAMMDGYLITFPERNCTINDFYIIGYYGAYNDVVAIMTASKLYESIHIQTWVNAAGIIFIYPDNNNIMAWDGDRWFKLPEAYDAGILTRDDIETIRDIWESRKLNIFCGE